MRERAYSSSSAIKTWACMSYVLICASLICLCCCTGDALITFNYERHAVNCICDHAPGRLQQLCAFMPCVQQGRKTAPRLKGNVIITVVRYASKSISAVMDFSTSISQRMNVHT